MIYTRCTKCHQVYEQGTYCPKCSRNRIQRSNKKYNKKRGAEVKFYQSSAWRSTKAEVINYYHSIDIWVLGMTGKIVPCARPLVHHIVEYKKDKKLALDFSNLIPVSTSSHNMIHSMYDCGQRDKAIEIIRKGIEIFEKMKKGDFDGS